MKIRDREAGQSVLEFAFVLPLLLLLAILPVDFFRYAITKMNLESAAVEAVNQVTEADLKEKTGEAIEEKIRETVERTYGDSVSVTDVDFTAVLAESSTKEETRDEEDSTFYYYYVYDSDLSGEETYGGRFERRNSHYSYYKTSLQLSAVFCPVTLIGKSYFIKEREDRNGNQGAVTLRSSVVRKDVFAEGYQEKKEPE